MIDESDENAAWLASMLLPGWPGLIAVVIFIVLAFVVCQNRDECAQMHCPGGQSPTLQNHDCQCITKAVP